MTLYQDTSPTDTQMFRPLGANRLAVNPAEATTAARAPDCLSCVPWEPPRLEAARQAVCMLTAPSQRSQAETLLAIIQHTLATLPSAGPATDISPLRAVNVDDGSLLIEWPFPDVRVGFSIEPDPQESSWFFVSGPGFGRITAHGDIAADNFPAVAQALLRIVLSNA